MEEHDPYVYGPVGGKYGWRCLTCPVVSKQMWRRRRDADDDAYEHILATRPVRQDGEHEQGV